MSSLLRLAPGRIIPARAGFTARHGIDNHDVGDHPRSRGVYRALAHDIRIETGIIPARAGFTLHLTQRRGEDEDHPRSRGVYDAGLALRAGRVGSSPLARGLPGSPGTRQYRKRIIPARAGFTRGHARRAALVRDHPRSRGVYATRLFTGCEWKGSSPLARGLHWSDQ